MWSWRSRSHPCPHVLANKVHSVMTKSYEAACPMRRSLRKKDNIWWNSELASLRKKARRAWRKTIKTKQEDWEAQELALSYFKKAVRRAKCNSWHSFAESMKSQTSMARLVKIIQRNETVRVSNVIKHNGEFTKFPLETLNYLLDILSTIQSSGPDGLYPVAYCYGKVGINWKDITTAFFKHAWDTAMCHCQKRRHRMVHFYPNSERKAMLKLNPLYNHFCFIPTEMVGKTDFVWYLWRQ